MLFVAAGIHGNQQPSQEGTHLHLIVICLAVDIVEQSDFSHIEDGSSGERNGTHQQLGGQGINCRRKDGVLDGSTFLIVPISRRDKSAENLFATLFPLLIQSG